ncbi:MAG: hypothetical protein JWQ90_1929 [Hydrocarboniphaga sp.]|nr:hypothetical protein [Hydrocarboniphaga sp.]
MFRKVLKVLLALALCVTCITAAAGMQDDRMAFIQKLVSKGVFQKVEVPGTVPHLWVRPAFYALDFDTKSQFVNVVYAYYVTENPKYDLVVLYDSKTGKKIGTYSKAYGGLKLE